MDSSCIAYKDTGFFSHTVIEYIEDAEALRPFYAYRPDWDGFDQIIKNEKVNASRETLAQVLTEQYTSISDFGFSISDLF